MYADLMPFDTGNDLLDFALGQVDESLRTVAILYETECEILYLRDDLEERYSPSQYKAVAGSFRTEMGFDAEVPKESPVGQKTSIIHHHEHAFVFQFPHEECHSILLSVEPEVGSRLQTFIDECRQRM